MCPQLVAIGHRLAPDRALNKRTISVTACLVTSMPAHWSGTLHECFETSMREIAADCSAADVTAPAHAV